MKPTPLIITTFLLTVCAVSRADNRNVMLNAQESTVPREINIGLPESGNGSVVYVDGTKHAWGLPRSQYHWSGGNAYEPLRTVSLMDAVITTGEVGVLVDSRTKFGGEKLSGAFTGMSSTNGLIRFDLALNGPIGRKGWYFSLGAYANYDPTNVNAPSRLFVEQKQIYQLSLTKRTECSEFGVLYRFSYCGDRVDGGYSVAPFIYNGDGTISPYNGFSIGRDCYMPADETVSYMDLASGRMMSGDMSRMDRRILHDILLRARHRTGNDWNLSATFHGCIMPMSQFLRVSLAGIDKVEASRGMTLSDGTPFSGMVQNRLAVVTDLSTADFEIVLNAENRIGRHKLQTGASFMFCDQYEAGSSFNFAHTVEVNPVRLLMKGANTWSLNRNSTYMDGMKGGIGLYALDDWTLSDRVTMRTGLMLKPKYNFVKTAARLDGEDKNKRVEGFNIADKNLCELHDIGLPCVDWAVSEHLSYRIAGRLFAIAEGFCIMSGKTTTYFKNATIPTTLPVGNAFGRGGLSFDNKLMDVTALVSYITSWNNAKVMTVTKQIGGVSETIPWTAQYGIGTLGITLDGNLHAGAFGMHAMVTWQDPRYKNYRNEFQFSDGSVTVIDYTGKYVTGISQVMAELDPSYSWKKLKLWASVRYYSRQYASRTNLAYFNGHFETFAGADWRFGEHSKLSLNLVNLLFQNGAKGSVDIADTIEDAAELQGYVMAGSYIRPFTTELSYTYSF